MQCLFRLVCVGFLLVSLPVFSEESPEQPLLPAVSIAMVVDSPEEKWEEVRQCIETEISLLLKDDASVVFSPCDAFVGSNTPTSIRQALQNAWMDEMVTMVVAIGPLSSHFATQETTLPKPTFAPFIINPAIQQAPIHDGASGVTNLNYLSYPTDIRENIRAFQKLLPLQTLHLVFEERLLNAIPQLPYHAESLSREMGVQLIPTPIRSAADAIHSLPPGTQAVYILPLFHQSPDAIEQFADDLIQRNIPSFTLFSKGYIDKGFLVSDAPDSGLTRLARRLALNIQQTFLGEDPSAFPIEIPREDDPIVNMATARKLGFTPPWEFLLDSVAVYNEEEPRKRPISLPAAVQEGLQYNLQLDVARRGVLAAKQDVYRARSRLYPQIDVGALSRVIDRDRAKVSRGTNPQAAVVFDTSFSQMIYSNRLLGDARIQTWLQFARIYGFRSSSLDIAFDISRSYLDFLRAQTIERIERNNLALTRYNLKVAEQRVRVGAARKSEVYRWESEVSGNKTRVVEAHFRIDNAQTTFNRLLHRPQCDTVSLEEIDLRSPCFVIQTPWLDETMTTATAMEAFSRYAMGEAYRNSPELREMEKRIQAQEEVLGVAKRAFYTPDVFLGGDWRRRLYQGGTASHDVFSNNRTEYQVGINLTFPLSKGGERLANKQQAWQELMRLRTDWFRLVEMIEEQIRISIQNATSSYNAIGLAQEAAQSAQKNLRLVQDAYAKGSSTIITLLDAQNQALNADLVTTNAIYDFLTDLMALQRVMGRFDFDLSPQERCCWWQNVRTLLEIPS